MKVTKNNFFKLQDELIEQNLKKSKIKNFQVSPLNNPYSRFIKYIAKITPQINLNIENEVFEILQKIQNEYNKNPILSYEKFLLRILGVLCNTIFIGPQYFHLDICNSCNLDCNYCWFYSKYLNNPPSNEFKKHMIEYNDFTNIIDDHYKLKTDTILFTGAGEPFLHPDISKMITYVKQKGIGLQIFTNGTKIKDIKNIIDSKVDELFISVSASNPKTYKKVHPKQKKKIFFDCQNHIIELVKQRKNSNIPNIVLLFVLCKDNYKDIIEMAKWADNLGVDSIRYQISHNSDAKNIELNNDEKVYVKSQIQEVLKTYKNQKLHINPNILFQLENSIINNEWYQGHFQKKGCFVGWFFSRLWADKMYSFCCIRKEIEHISNKNSFEILWKSNKYQTYRNSAKHFGTNNTKLKENYYLIDKDCNHCGNYEVNEKVYKFLKDSNLLKYI